MACCIFNPSKYAGPHQRLLHIHAPLPGLVLMACVTLGSSRQESGSLLSWFSLPLTCFSPTLLQTTLPASPWPALATVGREGRSGLCSQRRGVYPKTEAESHGYGPTSDGSLVTLKQGQAKSCSPLHTRTPGTFIQSSKLNLRAAHGEGLW